MLRGGTTTIEVKSGYGLTTADELKMLRAITTVGGARPQPTVVATALLGHAIDPGFPGGRDAFVQSVIDETLPAVHAEFPGAAVDAFCEEGAWTRDECAALFDRALALGHDVRVHADQFNALGMVGWCVDQATKRRGAGRVVSVDHLEATGADDLRRLGASGVFGVALPATGFHTDGRHMDARPLIDSGGALVIATNWNPGSSPTASMPFVIALAVRKLGLSPAEAIAACTVNAAALLGFDDRGVIAPGKRADVILLKHADERMLAYEVGGNPVDVVVCGGEVVVAQDRDAERVPSPS
jgi:imidazolonepropionase